MSARILRPRSQPTSISLHAQAIVSDEDNDDLDEKEEIQAEVTDSDHNDQENVDPLEQLSQAASSHPQSRKKRAKYHHRLTDNNRMEIARLHIVDGKTASEIVNILNTDGITTSKKTVESVLRVQRREGRVQSKHSAHHQSKYTATDERTLIQLQQQHNDWTYSQLRSEWQRMTNSSKHLSNGTIKAMLDRNHITSKNLIPIPVARNTQAAIDERKGYCEQAITWDRDMLIFIDETGFDKHLYRKRGRNTRGRIATYSQVTSAGNRLNVCAAVSPVYGIIMYRVLLSSWNQEEFSHFINDLLKHPLVNHSSHYLVMDRVKWHHTELIDDVLQGQRIHHEIKLLPPYSPHLNPIEYCFHLWKTDIKNTPQTQSSNLREQVDRAAAKITPAVVSSCLDHVYQYYVHCINKKLLEDFVPYRSPAT